MSTDHEMDSLLRDAGSRWRSANPAQPPTMDFAPAPPVKHDRPRRQRWLIIASAAAVVAVAAGGTWLGAHHSRGGSSQAAGVPSSLTGIDWRIGSVRLETGNPESPGPDAELHFNSDGTFTGNDGVNSMSGSVLIDAMTMHFEDVAISAVGTTDTGLGKTAAEIDSIVQGDATWTIQHGSQGDQLVIVHAGVGGLYLAVTPSGTSTAPPTLGGLTGTNWAIFEVTAETSNSVSGLDTDGSTASLLINADGTFTGSDGCHAISGKATLAATTLTIADLAATGPDCTGQLGGIASKIDQILHGTVSWGIGDSGSANDLSIEHPGVGSLIYFGPKPASGNVGVTDPAKLPGTWVLTQYQHEDGNSGSGGASGGSGGSAANGGGAGPGDGLGVTLTISADGAFTVRHRCYADKGAVSVGAGAATWSGVTMSGALPCPSSDSDPDQQDINSAVDTILSGKTMWTIDASGSLTISRDAQDSLGFARSGS